MRVLDACAAPGGKTCHLLELADLDLTALDADAVRLARVHDNLQRLQLKARVQRGDASRSDWWDQRPYDRILADVPCTASGVVRRHPDSRWLRRKTDTAQLAALSARILDNLWRMLAPGGKMLMVTCSVWPANPKHRLPHLPHGIRQSASMRRDNYCRKPEKRPIHTTNMTAYFMLCFRNRNKADGKSGLHVMIEYRFSDMFLNCFA
jgi:SAM-dependent methyltransferase